MSELEIENLIASIKSAEVDYVCWTGGEPLMQWEAIKEVVKNTPSVCHHIETNGDLIKDAEFADELMAELGYVAISPKVLEVAKRVSILFMKHNSTDFDIKVVTDLKDEGVDMIPFATCIMPLTSFEPAKDADLNQEVWNYCVKNNIKLCPRFQIMVWGKERGI